MSSILFKEVQTEGAPVLSYIISAVFFILFLLLVIKARKLWMRVMISVGALILLSVILIMGSLRLETIYYPDEIAYRFTSLFPSRYNFVSKDSIINLRIIYDDPHTSGLRQSARGDIYKVSGAELLQITFRSGSTLALGTQKPIEIYNKVCQYYPFIKPLIK